MRSEEGGVMDIQKNRKEHVLKTDPAVFQDVLDGKKTFEIRFNDRGYQVGDLIVLKETKFTGQQMREGSPLIYTGREMQKQISYILSGYGLQDGWVILGIQDIKATKAQAVPEWIETAIQPPEEGQKVIISGIYGVGIAEFSYLYKDEFVMYDMGASNPILSKDQVKFWMPLPDAPQEPAND